MRVCIGKVYSSITWNEGWEEIANRIWEIVTRGYRKGNFNRGTNMDIKLLGVIQMAGGRSTQFLIPWLKMTSHKRNTNKITLILGQ